jgi:hypothetical protein
MANADPRKLRNGPASLSLGVIPMSGDTHEPLREPVPSLIPIVVESVLRVKAGVSEMTRDR